MMITSNYDKMTVMRLPQGRILNICIFILLLPVTLGLSACYYRPYAMHSYSEPVASGRVSTVPSAQVYFFPKEGQTIEQQSRDHFECYNWAMKETGFDPGQSSIPTEQRVRVVPMPPPGYDTTSMAIAGAVLGALFGGPRHAFEGALIGASGGAIAGAASDSARQQEAQQMAENYATRNQLRDAQLAQKTLDFRRAMSACLEGRGYIVH